MTHWLLVTLITLVTVLAAIVVQLARTLRTQDNLIRALQYSVRLSKENAAIHEHRAATLERAFVQQQERIGLLVMQNGELEDRNACLERICRAKAYDLILALPTLDGPRVLERKSQTINLN